MRLSQHSLDFDCGIYSLKTAQVHSAGTLLHCLLRRADPDLWGRVASSERRNGYGGELLCGRRARVQDTDRSRHPRLLLANRVRHHRRTQTASNSPADGRALRGPGADSASTPLWPASPVALLHHAAGLHTQLPWICLLALSLEQGRGVPASHGKETAHIPGTSRLYHLYRLRGHLRYPACAHPRRKQPAYRRLPLESQHIREPDDDLRRGGHHLPDRAGPCTALQRASRGPDRCREAQQLAYRAHRGQASRVRTAAQPLKARARNTCPRRRGQVQSRDRV